MPGSGRILRRILLSLFLILAALFGFTIYLIRNSFPDFEGEIKLAGLNSTVRILRDRFGIPQIYASNQHDLFFAQGFVHAQDRFWQMDVWRHTGGGRLSEMFGASQVETDRFLRTLGWERVVRRELEQTDSNSRSILESYAAGVNAYLKKEKGSGLSFEYSLLKIMNSKYKIEDWHPVHSATFGKVMSWDLCENMFNEIQRSVLLKTLTAEHVNELYPPYPDSGPFVVPSVVIPPQPDVKESQPVLMLLDPAIQNSIQNLHASTERMPNGIGIPGESIGSNNWAISGSKTTTGKPFLANDPHLEVQMPSIWYEAGLHCEPVNEGCPFDVTGFSFAGVPGIVLGHNARVAWAMTNVGADVMDLYIEKINPQNSNQYLYRNSWKDMKIITEKIHVAGSEDVTVAVRYTHHGPIISDSLKTLENFGNKSGQGLPQPYAIALRWTAIESSDTFPAIWKMNMARNWDEFRAAASEFDVPSQNLVFADIDGNIGYQTPGLIPIRAKGDGRFPVPGWTGEYEWTGYIPFDQLPSIRNPSEGFIVSANNQVISSQYPYLLTTDWEAEFRAKRIVELLHQNKKPIDAKFIETIQGDNKSLKAAIILPHLLKLKLEEPELQQFQNFLGRWDQQDHMNSAGAALFEVFWKHLLVETFHDDLPEQYWPGGSGRWANVIKNAAMDPANHWWDNRKTGTKEMRDEILRIAFSKAVQELQQLQGKTPEKWKWGALHTVTFQNQTLGKSGIGSVETIFNRGPFQCSGGSSVVNATAFNPRRSFEVTAIPSMRMIADLSSFDQCLAINSTGQSGHAYHPNYVDMADLWRNVQYHPWVFTKSAAEKQASHTLVLNP